MLKKAGILCAGLVFLTCAAASQDGRFDVSGNLGATFTKTSSGNGINQSATAGSDVFLTVGMRLAPKNSLIFNLGTARNSQTYESNYDFHVLTHTTEYSGAWRFAPVKKGRFEPFVLAGGGVLKFKPQSTWLVLPDLSGNIPNRVQTNLGAQNQTKIAFLYGVGVDYHPPHFWRFSIRLQYRGLLYKAPDFNVNANGGSLTLFTGALGHMAEPSAGLVFRF